MRYDGNLKQLVSFYTMNGIQPGVPMDDGTLLLAVTEKRTKEEIDLFIDMLPMVNGAS